MSRSCRTQRSVLTALQGWTLGLILTLTAISVPTSAASGELRLALAEAQGPPMYIALPGRSAEGIMPALGAALAKALNRTLRIERLPRKRITALLGNRLDVVCHAHPAWYSTDPRLIWTEPYLQIWDVVVTAKTAATVKRPEDLRGRRLGTVLGYHYPALTAALGPDLHRDDGEDENSNWRRLAAGRIDAMVVSTFIADWTLKSWQDGAKPVVAPFRLDEIGLRCAGTDASLMAQINAALIELRRSGAIDQLLEPYR